MDEIIEVELVTDIIVEDDLNVTSDNNNDIEIIEEDSEFEVSVQKREYVITGDDMYIPLSYDESPQWLKDTINNITNFSLNQKLTEVENLSNSLSSLIAELEVAKNTYTQSIISSADIDSRINSAITTLNSNLSGSDANIIGLLNTKATPEQASSLALNVLTSSINDGEISAIVSSLQNTISNSTSALSNSIDVVSAEMTGSFEGAATGIQSLSSYVGIDPNTYDPDGTGILADIEILQKQNDGVIETISGTYDVIINPQDPNLAQLVETAEPYATWKASDVSGINNRLSHIGDVFIKYIDNPNGSKEYVASYKFIRTVVDRTSPYSTDSDGFTWALTIDQASQDAYTQALNAFDLADDKRRVFVSTPVVPYDIGDLWLVQTGATIIGTTQGGRLIQSGDTLRCCETKTKTGLYEHNDWIPADSYREGMNAIQTDLNSWRTGTYAPFVTSIQSQVDGKAETFYQNSVPIGRIKSTNVANNTTLNKYVGDLWKNTYAGTISGYLGDNTEYIYTKIANGSNWNYDWTKMEVPDIVFDTIDTKKSIYSGNSIPVAIVPDIIEINDMWITGSAVVAGYDKESIYVWNGTSWIKPLKYTDDSATVALQTGLANGTATVKLTNAFVGTTPFLTYITNEIDSKVGVYSGETAPVAGQPSGVAANDIYLWFTTASKVLANGTTQVYDITRTYKYSGSAWSEITTDSNITALADLADGKRTVFSGNTVPVGAVARDIWIPSATNGTYLKGEIYQYNGTSWIVATKYSADLEAVRSNLQSQVDGKVETYYQATVPTGMTSVNNGDYWYCTADVSTYKKGKVYKYAHATTSWVETADVSRYAFDTADGKSAIFLSTSTPTTGYKINDMLIVIGSFNNGTTTFSDGVVLSSNANRVSGFTASDWVKKINDTEDLDAFVSVTYTPTVTGLQNQVDGKVESWFQNSTSDPKTTWTDAATRSKHDGDLWYQLDTKRSYWYSSSTNAWNLIDDEKAIQALANAATAQTSANNAQTSANNAQTSANTANSLLADIASDSKFTQSEKSLVKKEWDSIQSEYTKNLAQGTSYKVSTAAYTTAYNALNTYITPLLASLTTTSDIVGTTFRATFKAYYDANVDLLNAISNKINLIADGKITSYYMATFSAVQSMSAAWTASEKTSNIGDLAVVYNDTTVDNNGTWRWDGTNWVTTRDKKLIALASDVTNLSTELTNGTNTWSSADNTLENSLRTEITDEGARVESKFAYNNNININGVSYQSGFGLATSLTSGSGLPTGTSEFWIKADKFKLMSADGSKKSAYSPFTVDSATGDINFNGKVSFTNVSDTQGSGTNLLYNSAPKIGNETKGWSIGWSNHGLSSSINSGFDIWRPTGGASVYVVVPGSPGIGTVFDISNSKFPVMANTRYEASAYLSSHRCNSYVTLAWFDSNGNYIYESSGTSNSIASSGPLAGWSRSTMFATAPSNAATAQFYVRSVVTSNDPYCFVAYAYAGIASTNQTIPSNWSEGSSAGVSSGDVVTDINNGLTTTINGPRITTGSITANQVNLNDLFAQNITYTGIITGGSVAGGGIIRSYNGNMTIDLVNGSIYIA